MYKRSLLSASIIVALTAPVHAEEYSIFDEVVVSATRTEQSKQDVSSSIGSVSSEDIDSQLATDLKDALDKEPGVDATTEGRFGISGFNIRGMEGSSIKVMVDGIKQPTPFNPGQKGDNTQGFYPNAIEIDTLTSLEVNKGPSSTLYGSDALGGSVVMKTKDPSDVLVTDGDEHRFGIKSGYSSKDEQFKNTLTWAMRQGDLETIVIGTYAQGSELKTFGDGKDVEGSDRGLENPADKELQNVLAKAYYQLNEAHRLGVVFERYASEYDENRLDYNYVLDMGPAGSFTYDDATTLDENTRTRFGINHEWNANSAVFDKLYWQLNFQTNEINTENYSHLVINDPFNMFGGNYDGDRTRVRKSKDKTTQFDAQFDKLIEASNSYHELTYGLNYTSTDFSLSNKDIYHDDPSRSKNGTTTIPDAELLQYGLFLQDNAFLLNERLVVTAGLRYDAYEADPKSDDAFETDKPKNNDSALTAKLGGVYHLNDNLSTFAQVSQGFKAPTVEQLYYEYDTGSDFTPNPNLEAEKSLSYEIGFRGQNESAKFEIVGFFNDYKDFIATKSLDPKRVDGNGDPVPHYTLENLDEAEIKGVEFTSTILLDKAFNVVDGTYLNLSVAYADGKDKQNNRSLDTVAPLTSVVGLGYDNVEHQFGGLVNLTMVATKDSWGGDEDQGWIDQGGEDFFDVPGYGKVDVTAYYRPINDLTLRAGLFNAFDKKYWQYSDIPYVQSEQAFESYSQPGRNWGVSLDYQF